MKKLFILFMMLLPVISYSQGKESVAGVSASSSDVIKITLSVESVWQGAGLYKNYLIMESSEPIGVDVTVYFMIEWGGQVELWWDTLSAGSIWDRTPIRETLDQELILSSITSYSPSQYLGRNIIVTIRD